MLRKRILAVGVLVVLLWVTGCGTDYRSGSGEKPLTLIRLNFSQPVYWKPVPRPDTGTYDYSFLAQTGSTRFLVHVRTVAVGFESARSWLQKQEVRSRPENTAARNIMSFTTEGRMWYVYVSEFSTRKNEKPVAIMTRRYVMKDRRTRRIVECLLVGTRDEVAGLSEPEINRFLASVSLSPEPVVAVDRISAEYAADFTSVAEHEFVLRGVRLLERGEYERAETVFNTLLEGPLKKKLRAELYYQLSRGYLIRGLEPYLNAHDEQWYNRAVAAAEQSLHLNPRLWRNQVVLGLVSANMQRREQAAAFLKKAVRMMPAGSPEQDVVKFHYAMAAHPNRMLKLKTQREEKKVDGIIFDEQHPVMVVEGKTYQPGESIAGYTILKITPKKALLLFDYRVFEFELGDWLPQP